MRVLLDGMLLCEETGRGTGSFSVQAACAATFARRRSQTLTVAHAGSNAARQSTQAVVEW